MILKFYICRVIILSCINKPILLLLPSTTEHNFRLPLRERFNHRTECPINQYWKFHRDLEPMAVVRLALGLLVLGLKPHKGPRFIQIRTSALNAPLPFHIIDSLGDSLLSLFSILTLYFSSLFTKSIEHTFKCKICKYANPQLKMSIKDFIKSCK